MTLIQRGNIIEGAVATLTGLGVPTNGTNEAQTVTIAGTPTGGTFYLTLYGENTGPIPYNATAAQVATALGALSSVGAANVAGSGGPLPGSVVTLTFQNALGVMNVPQVTANGAGLTGGASPTVTTATTTPGVQATGRSANTGQIYEDQTPSTGELWQNQGTPGAPSWVKVGPQT